MASGGVKHKNNSSAQQTYQGLDTLPQGPHHEPVDTLSKILSEIKKVHHSINETSISLTQWYPPLGKIFCCIKL